MFFGNSLAPRLLNRKAVGGIGGKLNFDRNEPAAAPSVERIAGAPPLPSDAARHVSIAAGIALGCYADGHDAVVSPLANTDDGRLHAAAEGHLTNAAALRFELQHLGATVRRTSMAEVIVRAHERWGTRAFTRLRGPFACAIRDAWNRRLVVARDHLGVRPLFFALLPKHGVAFASDLSARRCEPEVGSGWCPEAIDAY